MRNSGERLASSQPTQRNTRARRDETSGSILIRTPPSVESRSSRTGRGRGASLFRSIGDIKPRFGPPSSIDFRLNSRPSSHRVDRAGPLWVYRHAFERARKYPSLEYGPNKEGSMGRCCWRCAHRGVVSERSMKNPRQQPSTTTPCMHAPDPSLIDSSESPFTRT